MQYIVLTDARNGQLYTRKSATLLIGHNIEELRASSEMECLLYCQQFPGCKSTNYAPTKGICEINGSTISDFPAGSVHDQNFNYYDKLK